MGQERKQERKPRSLSYVEQFSRLSNITSANPSPSLPRRESSFFINHRQTQAEASAAPNASQQLAKSIMTLMLNIVGKYITNNTNKSRSRKHGLASARQMQTTLEAMNDQSSPADLASVKDYLFTYIRTATIGENKASGHRNSSLVVKMMQGLSTQLASDADMKTIRKQAKNEDFRECFVSTLEIVMDVEPSSAATPSSRPNPVR